LGNRCESVFRSLVRFHVNVPGPYTVSEDMIVLKLLKELGMKW
jgi:hypothetical protein